MNFFTDSVMCDGNDELDITVMEMLEEDDLNNSSIPKLTFSVPTMEDPFQPNSGILVPVGSNDVPTNSNNVLSNLGVSSSPDINSYFNPYANTQHIAPQKLFTYENGATSFSMACDTPLTTEYNILEIPSTRNSPTPSEPDSLLGSMGKDEIIQHLASLPAFFDKCFKLESEVSCQEKVL